MKPKIAITLGDSAGIGAEITAKALKSVFVRKACTPIIIGDIASLKSYGFNDKKVYCIDVPVGKKLKTKLPRPTKAGGVASFKALQIASELAFEGKVNGIVTAPICKKSWHLAGIKFTGHTDYFRKTLNYPDALMIFISKNINCALVTEHMPLSEVSNFITKKKVTAVCKNFQKALKLIPVKNPKILFCAVNPHMGDEGAFATEEEKTIKPALKKFRNVTLLPSDSAWQKYIQGKFGGIICSYHDQALIPLKTLSKSPVVHWTYGLPFIRTSPAHGTAFDIAGKGIADASSMIQAILFCAKLSVKSKK